MICCFVFVERPSRYTVDVLLAPRYSYLCHLALQLLLLCYREEGCFYNNKSTPEFEIGIEKWFYVGKNNSERTKEQDSPEMETTLRIFILASHGVLNVHDPGAKISAKSNLASTLSHVSN